ncbi:hypothetical protein E2C01_085569 [Portunus trituberculatus]|uniref:Uncharacterized protein n=1 Tax=Portunus trituberculatus TaxID=210409 RepID=A0A5B7J772_PORTR|nr:hypothetical protein [Portunus trituberculatus]
MQARNRSCNTAFREHAGFCAYPPALSKYANATRAILSRRTKHRKDWRNRRRARVIRAPSNQRAAGHTLYLPLNFSVAARIHFSTGIQSCGSCWRAY